MAPNPTLLLLDEPFSALDEELKNELHQETKKIFKEKGLTVVIVSHDKQEAQFFQIKYLLLRTVEFYKLASSLYQASKQCLVRKYHQFKRAVAGYHIDIIKVLGRYLFQCNKTIHHKSALPVSLSSFLLLLKNLIDSSLSTAKPL